MKCVNNTKNKCLKRAAQKERLGGENEECGWLAAYASENDRVSNYATIYRSYFVLALALSLCICMPIRITLVFEFAIRQVSFAFPFVDRISSWIPPFPLHSYLHSYQPDV